MIVVDGPPRLDRAELCAELVEEVRSRLSWLGLHRDVKRSMIYDDRLFATHAPRFTPWVVREGGMLGQFLSGQAPAALAEAHDRALIEGGGRVVVLCATVEHYETRSPGIVDRLLNQRFREVVEGRGCDVLLEASSRGCTHGGGGWRLARLVEEYVDAQLALGR